MTDTTLTIRPATEADLPAVLELLEAAMGWQHADPNRDFFDWKHLANPFGASPSWVAMAGDRMAGFRTFLRWEFVHPSGRVVRAVRAVDTATHPDFQGQGVFTKLTLGALADLAADGVELVFNTPNDKSRPGYLKMGWVEVGRLPTAVRPRSLLAPVRMARARVPADKWSLPCEAGRPAPEVLADPSLDALLARVHHRRALRTHLTPDHLRWRYAFASLRYRAITAPDGLGGGVAVFRLRRRGAAVEAVVADVLVPDGDRARAEGLMATVVRESRADYGIALRAPDVRRGWLPLPNLGPVLTARPLDGSNAPPLGGWDLHLGDVELF